MNIAYLSLGSNIEPRKKFINRAIEKLQSHEHIIVEKISSIYETEPVDYLKQDQFLNLVVKINTNLSSLQLLEHCQNIEKSLGRVRDETVIEKGPRTIDLDILLFNKEQINLDVLTVPHPRMHERAFVLVPLNEIAPQLSVPTMNQSVEQLVKQLDTEQLAGVVKWNEKI